jgi:hypothetical protein
MLHQLISVSDTPKIYPFATWESCWNLLRCPHRCQFALAETHRGCIIRSIDVIRVSRSGGTSWQTPLRLAVDSNSRRVVQPPAVWRFTNCNRSTSPPYQRWHLRTKWRRCHHRCLQRTKLSRACLSNRTQLAICRSSRRSFLPPAISNIQLETPCVNRRQLAFCKDDCRARLCASIRIKKY